MKASRHLARRIKKRCYSCGRKSPTMEKYCKDCAKVTGIFKATQSLHETIKMFGLIRRSGM